MAKPTQRFYGVRVRFRDPSFIERAGWIAGRRSGQRELYMHIPHADTLVEAARLARGAEEAPTD